MAFDYSSIFKYSEVAKDDTEYDDQQSAKVNQSIDSIVRNVIVSIFYALLVITFPISALFCFKRIRPLERCLIYRLGHRLPIRGPGIIIKFPLIDCIEVIDLTDHQFVLIDITQQLLTSDGSIIQFNSSNCTLNVINVIKSSTQLKDAKFNAEQFVKLSFINMIGSTHVEDIEMKMNIIISQFETNCNLYLNNWGYNCKFTEFPKLVITSRANPINPIVSQLKGLFGAQESSGNMNGLMSSLMNMNRPKPDLTKKEAVIDDGLDLLGSLQSMANKYSKYVYHDLDIAVRVEQLEWTQYFKYRHNSGNITKTNAKPDKVHIDVKAKTKEDMMQFCSNNDLNSVEITTILF